MEFEERTDQNDFNADHQRNDRPKEASKNLPMAILLVLVGIICALLYIGWKYMSDSPSSAEELTPAPADSVARVAPKVVEETVANATTQTPTDKNAGLPPITVATVDKKAETAAIKTEAKPAIPTGGEIISHTVDTGETFLGIANRYNMKSETLKKMNPTVDPNTGVKIGATKLNIRVKALHTVGPGDILRVVSQKYNVPVPLIMAANKKAQNHTERGEQLVIPFPSKQ